MWSRLANRLVVVAVLVSPSAAFAEAPEEQSAELLFREARKLLAENDYSPACEKLEQSQRLDPAAGTLILLAFCHEKMGRYATAHREYLAAAKLAGQRGDAEKSAAATRFAEKVRVKQHVLVVALEDPDAEVRVDDVVIPRSGKQAELGVDPGAHTISVRRHAKDWQKGVSIPTTPGRTIVNVPASDSPTDTGERTPRSWWSDNALGLTALGVGVVGLGVGTFFGLRAFQKNDDSKVECDEEQHCSPRARELRDEARTSAMISNIAFGVGIIGVGTGSFMLLSSGSSRASGFQMSAGGRF